MRAPRAGKMCCSRSVKYFAAVLGFRLAALRSSQRAAKSPRVARSDGDAFERGVSMGFTRRRAGAEPAHPRRVRSLARSRARPGRWPRRGLGAGMVDRDVKPENIAALASAPDHGQCAAIGDRRRQPGRFPDHGRTLLPCLDLDGAQPARGGLGRRHRAQELGALIAAARARVLAGEERGPQLPAPAPGDRARRGARALVQWVAEHGQWVIDPVRASKLVKAGSLAKWAGAAGEIRPGDVIAWRASRIPGDWRGHVALVVGVHQSTLEIVGGNEGGQVCHSTLDIMAWPSRRPGGVAGLARLGGPGT